jgi:hypothetical protein
MSGGVARIQPQGAVEVRKGCRIITEIVENGAAATEGLGIVRIECQRLGEALQSLIRPVQGLQHQTVIVERHIRPRLQPKRGPQVRLGFRMTLECHENDRQHVQGANVVRRLAQNAAELTFGIAKSALLKRGESTLKKIGRRRHCVRDFGSSQRRRQIEAGYSGRPGRRRGQGLVSLRASNTSSRAAIPK